MYTYRQDLNSFRESRVLLIVEIILQILLNWWQLLQTIAFTVCPIVMQSNTNTCNGMTNCEITATLLIMIRGLSLYKNDF